MNKIFPVIVIAIMICVMKNVIYDDNKQEEIINNNKTKQEVVILEENTQNNIIIDNTNKNEVSNQVMENEKVLENKTIAFIGDSLVRGYGNDDKGFDYYLGLELPNTNFINNSKSGSTITSNSGEDNIVMINQANTIEGTPDVIVFDGGANDIMGYSLGFLNNDLKKEIGTYGDNSDSVLNDLQNVIIEMKNKYPNAKLCYIQPFLLDEETVSNLTR